MFNRLNDKKTLQPPFKGKPYKFVIKCVVKDGYSHLSVMYA